MQKNNLKNYQMLVVLLSKLFKVNLMVTSVNRLKSENKYLF